MRNAGKHLAFLAGNTAYWNIRLGAGKVTGRPNHLIICYKTAITDHQDPVNDPPTAVTTRFRSPPLNRPENALVGVMYMHHTFGSFPLIAQNVERSPEAALFLAAGNIHPGDTLPGIV